MLGKSEKAQESDSKVETGFKQMSSQTAMSIVKISEFISCPWVVSALHLSS